MSYTAKSEEKQTKQNVKKIEIKITQMSDRLNSIYEQLGPND